MVSTKVNIFKYIHFYTNQNEYIYKQQFINKRMNTSSYFIKNRALFGSYPARETVHELEEMGVRYFVDLTYSDEKRIVEYETKYTYIRYPIPDRNIPEDWQTFTQFILKLSRTIRHLKYNDTDKKHELLYLHCKGGHGRSGVVVACLLCFMGKYDPMKALELTSHYHSKRKMMRDIWRTMGAPQNNIQKNFVYRFFEPIYFFKAYKTGYTMGLSNFSLHSVETEIGTFPTSEAAFQAYKNPMNKEYVQQQVKSRSPAYSKHIGMKCQLRDDWHDIRDEIMNKVVRLKFEQHEDIRNNLINTCLRPIIEKPIGNKCINNGQNKLGEILMKIRKELLLRL